MPRDPEKARQRKRRYLLKKKTEKYGAEAAHVDMRGKHGNHATGNRNGRWNDSTRRLCSNGYIAVRVPVDHPHGWGPGGLRHFKYAYEHVIVMMASINRALKADEVVHHKNGDRTDNRPQNLELTTPADHQRYHAIYTRQRDGMGRFQ